MPYEYGLSSSPTLISEYRYLGILDKNLSDDRKKHDFGDEIRTILRHTGFASPRLERLEKLSSRMCAVEWNLMKRDSDEGPR